MEVDRRVGARHGVARQFTIPEVFAEHSAASAGLWISDGDGHGIALGHVAGIIRGARGQIVEAGFRAAPIEGERRARFFADDDAVGEKFHFRDRAVVVGGVHGEVDFFRRCNVCAGDRRSERDGRRGVHGVRDSRRRRGSEPARGIVREACATGALKRGAETVRFVRPWRLVVVAHASDRLVKSARDAGKGERLLERDLFAIVLQVARRRPVDRDFGGDVIFRAERGGIDRDDERESAGREAGLCGEGETEAVEPPAGERERAAIWIGFATDFDEFIATDRGMKMDFVDARIRVSGQHEFFVADGIHDSLQHRSGFDRAVREAMRVAR